MIRPAFPEQSLRRRSPGRRAYFAGIQRRTAEIALQRLQEVARSWKPMPWLFSSFVITGLTSR